MALIDQILTDRYALYNGDCVEVMQSLPEGRVHLSVYSPPFATDRGGLYCYSSSDRDLSNCRDYEDFFEHYDFVLREIHRVTMPGRFTAVHCMPVPSGNTGKDWQFDFPGDVIRAHVRCRDPKCTESLFKRERGHCGHGWFTWKAEHFVWKEPLGVRNRTLAKDLAHRTVVDDSAYCGVASADHLLIFQKRGQNPVPIAHPTGLTEYAGSGKMPSEILRYRGWKGDQKQNRFSHWIWRRYADAFWDDVRIDRVLPYRPARDTDDEKHVHPLQLDAIERVVTLRSNPGETVLSPFSGVGSEVFAAVRLGRQGLGIELKSSYFRQAVRNLEHVDAPVSEQVSIEEEAFSTDVAAA